MPWIKLSASMPKGEGIVTPQGVNRLTAPTVVTEVAPGADPYDPDDVGCGSIIAVPQGVGIVTRPGGGGTISDRKRPGRSIVTPQGVCRLSAPTVAGDPWIKNTGSAPKDVG